MFLNRRWLVLAVAVALIAVGMYFWLGDDAERAVRARLDALIELVEKDAPASSLEAIGRSRKLVESFTEGASVEYYRGRSLPKDLDAMGAAFIAVWGRVDQASVDVISHEVTIQESQRRAESVVKARCKVIMDGSDRMSDTLTYRIYWSQVEGAWLIDRVVLLESSV